MKNELLTFTEAKTDIIESGHKSVSLYDKNGEKLIPFNSSKVPMKERLDEIEKRLNSRSTEDDIYQLKAKHYGSRTRPAVYYVASENYIENLADNNQVPEKVKTEIKQVEKPLIDKGHYTAEEYHKLYTEKIELDYELKAANDEIGRLEEIIEDLEKDEPESKGFLSDSNKEFLSGVMEQVTPLVDKMLSQRDNAQQIELLKIQMAQNGHFQPHLKSKNNNHSNPAKNNHQGMEDEEIEDEVLSDQEEMQLEAMEMLKEQDPELYQRSMRRVKEFYEREGGQDAQQ